jgi:hypothetical protein
MFNCQVIAEILLSTHSISTRFTQMSRASVVALNTVVALVALSTVLRMTLIFLGKQRFSDRRNLKRLD